MQGAQPLLGPSHRLLDPAGDVAEPRLERHPFCLLLGRERRETLPKVRFQLAQIQAMRDLGLSVYSPEGFQEFLRTPLPTFAGKTALQMIEQGSIDEVVAALAADYEGLGS